MAKGNTLLVGLIILIVSGAGSIAWIKSVQSKTALEITIEP